MTTTRLLAHSVEKPWGRVDIPSAVAPSDGRRIGEIWFSPPEGGAGRPLPLLVKYIFTSEKLSVQVHPDDAQARERGLAGGKSECWYILDAEPDARLGIGLTRDLTADALRAAALDGSIEALMDWKPVRAGSFYYIPAGTVHAIGSGVTLVEVQQNNDVTYRLYDYGRPRELHLEEAMAVSMAAPYALPDRVVPIMAEERLVAGGDAPFILDLVQGEAGSRQWIEEKMAWFIPLAGAGAIDGEPWRRGECWLIEGTAALTIDDGMSALLARLP
ncbi:phosphoheptose isomerase [Sphingobium indicum]|uniref:Phosphoheptose isomerase n=2 Tax=Sphingobium indicum TaxID=332055 RepID=A0A1L5BQS7_SPHIB|nr:class I mannose-6-phosphate isomerase [Sphingobium indicum]APL95254.1 phosphoheptose isomerase [Sphingobium indicum B90A]KEY99871.1 phosphoheptose isomerase [Sphingomonas sp. BHC-A]NYI22347.1 mannose-6-phosphate isomerase [Sphingobium indicum]RYM02648.1 phosphoheptose isomerase [Sphingobium indicum]